MSEISATTGTTAPFTGHQLEHTTFVADLLNGKSISTLERIYPLREVEFVRMQGGPPVTAAGAAMLFSGVAGFAVSLGPKMDGIFAGQQSQLTNGETKTIVIGVIVSVVLYVIGLFLPNERSKVMKRISKFFGGVNSAGGAAK